MQKEKNKLDASQKRENAIWDACKKEKTKLDASQKKENAIWDACKKRKNENMHPEKGKALYGMHITKNIKCIGNESKR